MKPSTEKSRDKEIRDGETRLKHRQLVVVAGSAARGVVVNQPDGEWRRETERREMREQEEKQATQGNTRSERGRDEVGRREEVTKKKSRGRIRRVEEVKRVWEPEAATSLTSNYISSTLSSTLLLYSTTL